MSAYKKVEERVRKTIRFLANDSGFINANLQLPSLENRLTNVFLQHLIDGNIHPNRIPLYRVSSKLKETGIVLADVISAGDVGPFTIDTKQGVQWKAPFIDKNYRGDEYKDFNALSVDLAYRSDSMITFIEHKIGAEQTYRPEQPRRDYECAQFARYCDWMISARDNCAIRKRNLILLSSLEFIVRDYYPKELSKALQFNNRHSRVKGYLMLWEDVFDAFKRPD